MNRWSGISLAVVTSLLGGCATLSEQQCQSVDWWQLGQSDAMYGYAGSRVELHRQACAKIGIAPDDAAWHDGYAQALPAFCVGGQGYVVGARNGGYHGQCPPELARDFLDGYRLGQSLHELDKRIAEEDKEIDRLRKSMRSDEATDVSRKIDERWLDHHKRERDRLQSDRWRIQDQARELGYPPVY